MVSGRVLLMRARSALATLNAARAAASAATSWGLSSSAMTAPRSTLSPTSALSLLTRADTRGLISTRFDDTSPWMVSGGGRVANQRVTPKAARMTMPMIQRTAFDRPIMFPIAEMSEVTFHSASIPSHPRKESMAGASRYENVFHKCTKKTTSFLKHAITYRESVMGRRFGSLHQETQRDRRDAMVRTARNGWDRPQGAA